MQRLQKPFFNSHWFYMTIWQTTQVPPGMLQCGVYYQHIGIISFQKNDNLFLSSSLLSSGSVDSVPISITDNCLCAMWPASTLRWFLFKNTAN